MSRSVQSLMRNFFSSPELALHASIRDGDLRKLRQLLHCSAPVDVNDQDYIWGTPLHVAVLCDSLAAVEELLGAGADALAVSINDDALPPIALAARTGHPAILRRLWQHTPPENHANGPKGNPFQTCLVQAAAHGHVSIVADLLDWWDGWTQDVKDESLLWAARRWQVYVVELLLSKALFEPRVIDDALCSAADFKYLLAEETDIRYDGDDYLNQQLLIAQLIDAGANPNGSSPNEPLVIGAARLVNLVGALKALLEKGADPNVTDSDGQSALHYLASPVQVHQFQRTSRLNETGIRLLLQHNASSNQRNTRGDTPLHRAAFGSNLRIFRLYLTSDQNLDQRIAIGMRNDHGETLLHFAAAGGKIDVMEFLLSQGIINVDEQSSNGWTSLICALVPSREGPTADRSKKLPEAIRAAQLLLSHGADPLVTTGEGWSPLHCLALHYDRGESDEAARFANDLILRGADVEARAPFLVEDPNARSRTLRHHLRPLWGSSVQQVFRDPSDWGKKIVPGMTPLHWAAQHGAVSVVKALLAHGADPSSGSQPGPTPARVAGESKVLERHPEVVEEIVELLVGAGGGF
ncbi:hypothetical protein DL770_006098 [Monosporascus sp. CRB-9-2]|nr:hypothetical protein DL770_006098 [Monosporascus sp. CRB-9-2]